MPRCAGHRLTILKVSSVPLRAPRVPQVGPGGQWLGKRRERRRGRSGGPWEALRRGNAAEPAGRWRTAGIEKDLSAGSEVIFSGFDACGMGGVSPPSKGAAFLIPGQGAAWLLARHMVSKGIKQGDGGVVVVEQPLHLAKIAGTTHGLDGVHLPQAVGA